MTGYINNILQNENGKYGFIVGEDGGSYYFDSRFLLEIGTMNKYNRGDKVEFEPQAPSFDRRNGTAQNVILSQVNDLDIDLKAVNFQKCKKLENIEREEEEDQLDRQQEIVKYFKPGYAHHLNKSIAFKQCLKANSGEDIIIDKLSEILYISRIGDHVIDQRSHYQFCLAGATDVLKQYVRGKYEFLIVFSHFDSTDWQQKNLIVEREIRKRREISDRRPLINFYILICNADKLKSEINKVKGGTSAAVIPFTFEEFFSCNDSKELSTLVVTRFGEYFFENNMLGETNAIDDDNLLFGDRGKIADSIVQRCCQSRNSGIFGLRRSGKTSVLNAVMRRLERDKIKFIKIESRSDLENLDSWKTALFDISRKIRQAVLAIEQYEDEDRVAFLKRLNLNSTEEDYQKRPSQYFVEDVKLYCKNNSIFVIAIDEVELITYNTAKTSTWKNVEAYCGFWGALRDCGCALIVSGVNSTINEVNTILFNGIQGDNPMYGRIISCTDFSSTYLPVFTDEQTKQMINVLGEYSNIAFSNVYSEINRAFGGQPYAIRQFCSFIFESVKHLRKPNEIYEVSKASVEQLLVKFANSAEGNALCEIILQHLTIFKDEYAMLKKIALSPEKYNIIQETDISQIDHLQKYGLIEYDYSTRYVAFRIHSIKDYICKTSIKNPMDMTNDERRQYIQDCVEKCEIKLKTYIRDYYIYNNTEKQGRTILKRYINVNRKAKPTPDVDNCKFRDFFEHKKFIFYFSAIRTIIQDNWGTLGKKFTAVDISKEKFCTYMLDLNAGRNDADHYDAEDKTVCPEEWTIDNKTMGNFITAYNNISSFFRACNLE